MSRLAQQSRIMAAVDRQMSIPVPRLFAAVFREGPVFRMGYDAHVQAWKREMGAAALLQWRHNRAFREAYEAQVEIDRNAPLPAWCALDATSGERVS